MIWQPHSCNYAPHFLKLLGVCSITGKEPEKHFEHYESTEHWHLITEGFHEKQCRCMARQAFLWRNGVLHGRVPRGKANGIMRMSSPVAEECANDACPATESTLKICRGNADNGTCSQTIHDVTNFVP